MMVNCPQCNTEYEAEESMRGQKFKCQVEGCPGIIEIPDPEANSRKYSQYEERKKIKVTCPQCNTKYKVKESMRGQKFKCKVEGCPGIIGIPDPEAKSRNYLQNEEIADCDIMKRLFELQCKFFFGIIIAFVVLIPLIINYLKAVCAVMIVHGSVEHYAREAESASFLLTCNWIVLLGLLLAFYISHYIFMHKAWKLLPQKTAVTTPNKAIWLNLVPFLRPFWQWVTYFELGKAYSDLSGRRANKVFGLIYSVMNTLGGIFLILPHLVMTLVLQWELLRSAEIIADRETAEE